MTDLVDTALEFIKFIRAHEQRIAALEEKMENYTEIVEELRGYVADLYQRVADLESFEPPGSKE